MTKATSPLPATARTAIEVSFHAAMASSPNTASGGIRRACARVTARTEPKLEIAACCASGSDRPASIPAVVASRR